MNKKQKIDESLVYHPSEADGYGTNNLRDMVLQYYNSGKTENEVYNILRLIGVTPDRAKYGVLEYYPKKNNIKMAIKEKLGLKDKIETLIEKISKFKTKNSQNYYVIGVKNICEKYLKALPIESHGKLAKTLTRELKPFNWMDSVNETIESIEKALGENIMASLVDEAYNKLKSSAEKKFYKDAIARLETILPLDEEKVRDEIKYRMSNYAWIPHVKFLIESNNSLTGDLSSSEDVIINRKYSPVGKTKDGDLAFYLSGNTYAIKENKLVQIDPITLGSIFLTLISVTENFKFEDNSLSYYKGKNAIKIKLNEDSKPNSLELNGKPVNFKDGSELRSLLLSTNTFNINETDALDTVICAYENADQIVELDFVQSITPRKYPDVTVNVIRLNENLYINKINPKMMTNECVLVESATEAVDMVKEYINYDISKSVTDLLEGEEKEIALKEAKKEDLVDKINFLKGKREKLAEVNVKSEAITEADKVLVSEIERFQKELNFIASE